MYCSEQAHVSVLPRNYLLSLEEIVGIILSFLILVLLIALIVCVRRVHVKRRRSEERNGSLIGGHNGNMNMIQNDINCQNGKKKNARNRTRKLNNYELVTTASRDQDLPLLPQRPVSISPTISETPFNYNMDNVRSYGDELETLPRIPHDFIQNIQKPVATVAPSLISDRDMNLKDNYFRKKSPAIGGIGGDNNSTRPPSSSSSIFFRQAKQQLRVNLPNLPVDLAGDDTCQSELSMEDEYQRYHWDCSDWATQAQTTLPALSELPNGEIRENASWLSDIHRNNSTSANTIQPYNLNEPVDPTRDIETLPEDDDVMNDVTEGQEDGDNDSQLGAVFPDDMRSPMHQTNKSIEELMLANGVNYVDEGDEEGDNSLSEEIPNSYSYKLHLNNYLPTYHLGSDPETDDAATPMLNGRLHINGGGYPSPGGGYAANRPYAAITTTASSNVKPQPIVSGGIYALRGRNTAMPPSNLSEQAVLSDSEDRLCVLEDLPEHSESSATATSQIKRTPSPRVTQV